MKLPSQKFYLIFIQLNYLVQEKRPHVTEFNVIVTEQRYTLKNLVYKKIRENVCGPWTVPCMPTYLLYGHKMTITVL